MSQSPDDDDDILPPPPPSSDLADIIREHPIAAVVAAALIGVLLGKMAL